MSKSSDDGPDPAENLETLSAVTELDLEADHRIANSLSLVSSLLKLQARNVGARQTMTGTEARAVLEESAARIDAVGRLHRLLVDPQANASTNVSAYLTQIGEILAGLRLAPRARQNLLRFQSAPDPG